MRSDRQTPRSFRLNDPEWTRLKIVALEQGYKSRYQYLTAHLTAIANASTEKAPDTV
jgi:hypothetical protein